MYLFVRLYSCFISVTNSPTAHVHHSPFSGGLKKAKKGKVNSLGAPEPTNLTHSHDA